MNKLFFIVLASSILFFQHYYGSTTAAVTLAGGIIKAKHIQETSVKYKRKDCPVCKGKGWYMSGDGILKIDCTYCELDKGSISIGPITSINPRTQKQIIEQPQPNCYNGQCKPYPTIRR